MAEAERLLAAGHNAGAARWFLRAAESEIDALRHIPASRPKTRGINAVSAVSLYRQAGALSEAIRLADQYLAERGSRELPEFAQRQLRSLLDDAQREQLGPAEHLAQPTG